MAEAERSRRGSRGQTRDRLLAAAGELLAEEGYAAVTSRRVGTRAGVKPQLVHYYFATMDELFIELFRRHAERDLAAFVSAVSAPAAGGRASPTLARLWELNRDPRGAIFALEFLALARHRPALRSEVAAYAERFRAAQVDAMTEALHDAGVGPDRLPPLVALLMMTGLTQTMALEASLGVTSGHAETVDFVGGWLSRLGSAGRES